MQLIEEQELVVVDSDSTKHSQLIMGGSSNQQQGGGTSGSGSSPPSPTSSRVTQTANPDDHGGASSKFSALSRPNSNRSVVPDLMRVYESLTQSSTPQQPTAAQSTRSVMVDSSSQIHHDGQHHQGSFHHPGPQQSTHKHPRQPEGLEYAGAQYQTGYDHHTSSITRVQHQHERPQTEFRTETRRASPPAHPELPPMEVSHGFRPSTKSSLRPQEQQHGRTISQKRSLGRLSDAEGGSDGDSRQGEASSNSMNSARKKGKSDGRWSKRFTWPEELHRDFVSAVFDVGLKHSSPSAILEYMTKHEQITSERVKSHLQKYRINREKSKSEFMASYDAAMVKLKTGSTERGSLRSLSSGEVPAYLTYSSLAGTPSAASEVTKVATGSDSNKGAALVLPQLSDEEKQSPIGASFGYLMGLFFALRQQLTQHRSAAGKLPPLAPQAGADGCNDTVQEDGKSPPSALHTNQNGSIQGALMGIGSLSSAPAVSNLPVGPCDRHQAQHHASVQDTSQSKSAHEQVTGSQWAEVAAMQGGPPPASARGSQQLQNYPQQQPLQDQLQGATPFHQNEPPYDDNDVSHSSLPGRLSTNPNVEESNKMKREMQNQMAIQSKMRALKQQEINKYSSSQTSIERSRGEATGIASVEHISDMDAASRNCKVSSEVIADASKSDIPERAESCPEVPGANQRGVEEAPSTPKRSRVLSEAVLSEDFFWNSDMVDEQLFEFLMNND